MVETGIARCKAVALIQSAGKESEKVSELEQACPQFWVDWRRHKELFESNGNSGFLRTKSNLLRCYNRRPSDGSAVVRVGPVSCKEVKRSNSIHGNARNVTLTVIAWNQWGGG